MTTGGDDSSGRDGLRGLLDLGLSTREARAYVALLRHAPATAAELADAAGISRPKVYEALKSLEQRGFCTARGGRVSRFHPVDPEVALSEWTRRREQQRRMATQRDDRLVGELVKTLPVPERASPGADGRYMHARIGVESTLDMFAGVTGRAQHRLDIIVTEPVIQERSAWNVNETAALRRGVSLRVIYSPELIADRARYEAIVAAGAEVRCSDDLPLKMVVRDDGAEATVSLVADSDGDLVATSVGIGHPDLAAPFQLLFNRQWRHAAAFLDI
jgi:HTH-type transcriptional regulator, sugar sensing transcriptional regulator